MGATESTLLSISDVARFTGFQSSALRYYEGKGLIKSATRVSGRRHYKESVLQRLAVITLLREVGFTISEIAEIVGSNGGPEKWRTLAEAKLEEIDSHLSRVNAAKDLLSAALECGCSGLDTCDLVQSRRGRHRMAVEKVTPAK